jgi:sterol desaturase/sphingolipid hydroxylase (fatty acid hydroxylase superfamily)
MTLPTILMICASVVFLLVERIAPGRPLPRVSGWYFRALLINGIQMVTTLAAGRLWPSVFGSHALFHMQQFHMPVLEGFVAWFTGTFVFYWWHRLRHRAGFWEVFHQIHHSPSRIEVVTSFYKHPLEILTNTAVSATILFGVLGCSILGGFWYNFFAGTGEYFYHANIRTPRWLRYVIQTPELHSIHHQYDLHSFNFGDIPLWDRIFGTHRDAVAFTDRCGFPEGAEQRLGDMLVFRDVYEA